MDYNYKVQQDFMSGWNAIFPVVGSIVYIFIITIIILCYLVGLAYCVIPSVQAFIEETKLFNKPIIRTIIDKYLLDSEKGVSPMRILLKLTIKTAIILIILTTLPFIIPFIINIAGNILGFIAEKTK